MRLTAIIDRPVGLTAPRQAELDAMWDLIENHYEEEWHVNQDGTVFLTVDDAMLERVLKDNYAVAWYKFGTFMGGQDKDGKRFLLSRPEYLQGVYTIEGIYDSNSRLVNGERSYYFQFGA